MVERLLRESTPDERVKSFGSAWGLDSTAYSIETFMINNGAVPGKDYTFLDLYKLAADFMKSKAIELLWDPMDDLARNVKKD